MLPYLMMKVSIASCCRAIRHKTLSFPPSTVIILGFEQPEYTVTEGDGSAEVCVRLFELGGIEGVASAFSTTISGTAGLYKMNMFLWLVCISMK